MPKKEEPQTTTLAPALTPMAMIEKAVASGAGIETLERLMSLQERWEANEARRDYDAAIAQARAKIKPTVKTREASFGSGKAAYKYEDLADIAEDVDPILAEYGLSYRWEAAHEGPVMIITCIVSHSRGHREKSSLPGKPDTSGSKNDIQALGSMVTYLQRYTLKLALGLAAAKDDDTHAVSAKPPSPPISDAQYDSLLSYMEAAAVTLERMLEVAGVDRLTDITEAQYLELEVKLKNRIKKKQEQAAAEARNGTASPT
jgi:hypothetical protein